MFYRTYITYSPSIFTNIEGLDSLITLHRYAKLDIEIFFAGKEMYLKVRRHKVLLWWTIVF